jgi:hypothetical protein
MEAAMTMRSLLVPLSTLVVLGGCVTVPTGPAVRVLPGSQKSFEQFQIDDFSCRQYAQTMIGGAKAGQASADAAAANAVGGTALGAAIGALVGSASGDAGSGAAVGAGLGLLVGGSEGANTAGYSSYAMQRDYDTAYIQCMYARGNQVPGSTAYRPASSNYPPPNYPPPNYPPPETQPPRE